jgi:hypothetical protein
MAMSRRVGQIGVLDNSGKHRLFEGIDEATCRLRQI